MDDPRLYRVENVAHAPICGEVLAGALFDFKNGNVCPLDAAAKIRRLCDANYGMPVFVSRKIIDEVDDAVFEAADR